MKRPHVNYWSYYAESNTPAEFRHRIPQISRAHCTVRSDSLLPDMVSYTTIETSYSEAVSLAVQSMDPWRQIWIV